MAKKLLLLLPKMMVLERMLLSRLWPSLNLPSPNKEPLLQETAHKFQMVQLLSYSLEDQLLKNLDCLFSANLYHMLWRDVSLLWWVLDQFMLFQLWCKKQTKRSVMLIFGRLTKLLLVRQSTVLILWVLIIKRWILREERLHSDILWVAQVCMCLCRC
jgi:hypothetical protein